MYVALGSIPALFKPSVMLHTCSPSTQQVGAGGFQGHHQVHSKFKVSLGSVGTYTHMHLVGKGRVWPGTLNQVDQLLVDRFEGMKSISFLSHPLTLLKPWVLGARMPMLEGSTWT